LAFGIASAGGAISKKPSRLRKNGMKHVTA
jgi:hypothetical protein